MALEGYKVDPISFRSARPFIEKWHYSHNVNGIHVTQCFGLFRPDGPFGLPEMVGACIYGKPAMSNQAERWCPRDPEHMLEIRRLVLTDNTPKNAESFFISKTLKWIKHNTDVKVIIAYADPDFGHTGIIYRASNFILIGMTQPGVILIIDGERYHDRTLRMDKPYAHKIRSRVEARRFQRRIKRNSSKIHLLI